MAHDAADCAWSEAARDSEQSIKTHHRTGQWGFGPVRWAAGLSRAARLPQNSNWLGRKDISRYVKNSLGLLSRLFNLPKNVGQQVDKI